MSFHRQALRLPMRKRFSSTTAPNMPRLPVPELRATLDRYLTSIQPFLRDSEQDYSAAYQLRKQWADEFYSGTGIILQERLIALDKTSPNNWLDDNFWIDKAYLEWRTPLLINSNWWLAFHDDDLIPESARTVLNYEEGLAGATTWQLKRAAWLVHRTLEFKDRLNTQGLHPETTRTGIWLRDSTSKMFNIARIPKHHCDTLSIPPSKPHSLPARSLLIMFHNFCYTIPIYSPEHKLASAVDIYRRLHSVVGDVNTRLEAGEMAFPIGVLSADDRDIWAKNLQHLLSLSPTNETSYNALLTTVMALSLDHTTYTLPQSQQQQHHPRSSTQLQRDSHLHYIRSTSSNVANRFFDKPYTVLVDPLSRAGATGEHSPCDALVPSIVAEYGIVSGVEEQVYNGPGADLKKCSIGGDGGEDGFVRLDWVVDEQLWKESKEAKTRALAIIEDSDDSVYWFDEYGTDWIKNVARFSPDAYIQMALQLAWYRTRGEFTATYETVLTRMFKRGRTETLRSYTDESRDWVLSMTQPNNNPKQQLNLLTKAILRHARLTKEAATGRGIDRHLLGLRLMVKPTDTSPSPSSSSSSLSSSTPALFSDPLFTKSQEWKLSTSGLSAGHWFIGTGFGAGYTDGYGINYLAAPEMIKFGIESKFSSELTSTYVFKNAVAEALRDMKGICLTGLVNDDIKVLTPTNAEDVVRSHL